MAFIGGIEQQLHAETDAEHRLPQAGDHLGQAVGAQSMHGIAGGADAGQDDVRGGAGSGRVGR